MLAIEIMRSYVGGGLAIYNDDDDHDDAIALLACVQSAYNTTKVKVRDLTDERYHTLLWYESSINKISIYTPLYIYIQTPINIYFE